MRYNFVSQVHTVRYGWIFMKYMLSLAWAVDSNSVEFIVNMSPKPDYYDYAEKVLKNFNIALER